MAANRHTILARSQQCQRAPTVDELQRELAQIRAEMNLLLQRLRAELALLAECGR